MLTRLAPTLILLVLVARCSSKNIFVVETHPEDDDDELVAVVVLFRHGDRSPLWSLPTDPYYNSSYWPQGYGKLLKKGIQRQYQLGQWFRNRYSDFLPDEYSANDLLVYSTDVDRTLMSAEANLAGLYPPVESHIWEESFLWEPIPVHRLATDDPILTMNSNCEQFDKLLKELEDSEFFRNVSEKNSELFEQLTNYTGLEVTSTTEVQQIYDVIYVYQNHNESFVPPWVDNVDLDVLKFLSGLEFAKPTFTDELKRLSAGPFINFLMNHFDTVIDKKDATKLLMLSAHDSTIATVLGGMSVYDIIPPEFASTVIWELRKSGVDYSYNILYKRNDTDVQSLLMGSYDEFKSQLEFVNIDIETWQKECSFSKSVKMIASWSIFIVIMLQYYI